MDPSSADARSRDRAELDRTTPAPQAPSNRPIWRSWEWLRDVLALLELFVLVGWLGTLFVDASLTVSGFWPAAGIAFAGLWQCGLSRWPGVALGSLVIALARQVPPVAMPWVVLAETASAVLAVASVRRLIHGRHPLNRSADTAVFLVSATVLCPALNALISATAFWLADLKLRGHFAELLTIRWLAHGMGVLLTAPVLLAWWPWRTWRTSRAQKLELATFVTLIILVGAWVFTRELSATSLPIPDAALVIPLFAWSAARFGRRGTTLTIMVLGVLSLVSALHERGPFPREGGNLIPAAIVLALGNVGVVNATVLLISVLVSEFRTAESGLRKTEVRFRILFEHSPDAVFVVGEPDEVLWEFNDRLPELLDLPRERLIGRSRFDFELGSPLLSTGSSIQSVFSPRTSEFDSQYRRGDGSIIDVNVTYSVIDIGGQKAYLMIARDVTARRRAEQQLRESEGRFRTLATNIPVMVAIQTDGVTTYVNPAAEKLSGRPARKLLQQDFLTLIHPDHRTAVQDAAEKCLRNERILWRREVTLLTQDGKERQIDLSLAPLPSDGRLAWLASALDVTDRRRSEERLQQLTAELFQASRLRLQGEMVAGVTHEFRHPVGAIANMAQGLVIRTQRGESLPATELLEVARDILDSVDRALATIERLRDLSKPHELDRQWLSLSGLVGDAAKLLKLDQRWSRVSIQFDGGEPPTLAKVDRQEMTQVLLNLMRNGLEAMEPLPESQRQLLVRLRREPAGRLRLSVIDSGSGVAKEILPKLFVPFNTNKPRGMGLGLSLCKRIVELHGGRLTYERSDREGCSMFHVTLPIRGA